MLTPKNRTHCQLVVALGSWGRHPVLLASLVLTLLTAFEPLVIDEAAVYYYARHVATEPSAPYGFEIFWYDVPEPANQVLMPPVLPYWWGLGIELFGDRPALWKLWLFPVYLMLAASVYALLRHLARGFERPLLWFVLLSPAILPTANLILDVPAYALGLASVALFDTPGRTRYGLFSLIAVGLLAALAFETKYTGSVSVGALVVHSILNRRWREGGIAIGTSLLLVVGWESYCWSQYGESHFVHAIGRIQAEELQKPVLSWVLGYLGILGAMAPGLGLLALSLVCRRGLVLAAIAAVILTFAVLPLLPRLPLAYILAQAPDPSSLEPELVLFMLAGLVTVGAISWCAVRMWFARSAAASASHVWDGRRDDLFVLLWLALEVGAFFVLSPFLAGRRAIGTSLLMTLLVARAASCLTHRKQRPRLFFAIVVLGVALGVFFQLADSFDAFARRRAVARVAQRLDRLESDQKPGTTWFVGHWGFQFYAERSGFQPLIGGRSRVREGDWIVVPDGVDSQGFALPVGGYETEFRLRTKSPWPWSTIPNFYSGAVPIRAQPRAQIQIEVYRILRDFNAAGPRKGSS